METVCQVSIKVCAMLQCIAYLGGFPIAKDEALQGWIHFTTPLCKKDPLSSSVDGDRRWWMETNE